MKFSSAVLVFLFFCTPILFCQIREGAEFQGKPEIHAFVETSAAAADGYDSPSFQGAGGFEVWQKHATTIFRTSVDTADQASLRGGTTFRIEGNSYVNVSRNIFIGGGGIWGVLTTSRQNRQVFHPYTGIGIGFEELRIISNWVYAGTDGAGGVRGLKSELAVPFDYYPHHVWSVLRFGVYSGHEVGCQECQRYSIKSIETGLMYRW